MTADVITTKVSSCEDNRVEREANVGWDRLGKGRIYPVPGFHQSSRFCTYLIPSPHPPPPPALLSPNPSLVKPDVLRPGIVGMRGSMVM